MTTYCRLCAEFKEPVEIITTISDTERLIEEKLIACCQWNVTENEQNLPQDICMFCMDKLDKCWLFSQSVQLAQSKLLEIFDNATESEPSKDAQESVSTSSRKPIKVTYDCNECSITFLSRIALEKHDCNASPQIYKCDICQKSFKSASNLRTHSKRRSDLKCEICSLAFCKETAFKKHRDEGCEGIIEISHIPESKPAFIDCISVIDVKIEDGFEQATTCIEGTTDFKFNEHKVEQSTTDLVVTDTKPIDKKDKPKKSSNYEHKQSTEKYQPDDDDGRLYSCYLCNRRFKKFPLLKGHMVVHTNPRKYKCQYCNSRFRTERHFTSHQKNHIDFFCDVCNKKCKSAFALKVHKRKHVGASVKMYGCEECDHFFVDVSTYYNHMRRRHGLNSAEAKKKAKLVAPNGSAKPYVCEQCGKDFLERSSLQAHSVVHLDIRPFKCDVCSKSFKNKYNLKTHQETHTGEKSVQCTECGKTYSRKSVLIKHMEEHTGVYTKIFSCDFCDRIFRSSYNMQNHRRTHTGEKPYRCDVCKYDVTTKSQLDRHLKTISHMNKLSELFERPQHFQ